MALTPEGSGINGVAEQKEQQTPGQDELEAHYEHATYTRAMNRLSPEDFASVKNCKWIAIEIRHRTAKIIDGDESLRSLKARLKRSERPVLFTFGRQ